MLRMYITTMTQKGQVTIPKAIREAVGIGEKSKVEVTLEKDAVKLKKVVDILDVAGSFKPKRKKGVLEARKAFEKDYTRF